MSSRDTKHAKGFSKRLLSSFRKGKKSNVRDKEVAQKDSQEAVGVHTIKTANIENAVALDATLQLESPNKSCNVKSIDAPVTPKRNLRHVLSAGDTVYSGVSSNSSTPRVPRFELGGTMSASTDSGIDCSILMSEKSSPEQFVSFTRHEAERLRMEQALNGSMLETLTEVDRSLSDSDSEKVVNDNDGTKNSDCERTFGEMSLSERQVDCRTDAEQSVISDNQNESLCVLKDEEEKLRCCDENPMKSAQKCERVEGDYVLLSGKSNTNTTPLFDLTEVVEANKLHKETVLNNKSDINKTDTSVLASAKTSHIESQERTARSVEDYYMSYYDNRTDEIKSAEARLRSEDSSKETLLLNTTHDIVDPIPVTLSNVVTHQAMPSMPSSVQLFVNENSAFAKAKSLKRTVSDVSKGFFDKLRPHHKEGPAPNNDHSHIEEKSFHIKKSGFSKLKKFGVKKNKASLRKRHPSDQEVKLFNHLDPGNLLMEEDEFTEIRQRQKTKSPVVKEIVHVGSAELSFTEDVTNNAIAAKSPVYKEVLSKSVKNELEASIQRRRSPVGQEETTIEELTSSISQMTSALCASSAESIACICDCKNKSSDSECCDKKKAPSPLCYVVDCTENQNECDQVKVSKCKDVRRTPSPQMFSGCIEVSCTPDVSETLSKSKILNNSSFLVSDKSFEKSPCNEPTKSPESKSLCKSTRNEYSSEDLNQSAHIICDDDSCDGCCDCDDSECSCEECTDLDCSNCCNVSPNTGNVDLLSSSSDSECSVGGSYEDLSEGKKELEDNGGSECVTPDKSSLLQAEKEDSPYSVSFHEVVCDNGDVMYVENSFSDFMNTCWNENVQHSPSCLAPPGSPCVKLDQSGLCKQSTLNQSLSKHEKNSRSKTRSRLDPRERSRRPFSPQVFDGLSPTTQNLSADSSFTNASFEGSFADASLTVRNRPDEFLSESFVHSSQESTHLERKTLSKSRHRNISSTTLNASCSEDLNSSLIGETSFNSSYLAKFHQNRILSGLNDSQFLNLGRINPNQNLNDSVALNLSKRFKNRHSVYDLNSSAVFYNAPERHIDPRLNRSLPFNASPNKSFNRHDKLSRSFHGISPKSSPLDLSMNRQKSPPKNRKQEADKKWVDRHVGQVFSPAKRVLHKNQGLTENDLCKQILDLYVSDAEESGFEATDLDSTLNSSSYLNASTDCSGIFVPDVKSETGESSGSEGEQSCLQYGTYVAPRNVVKETNVDDFTTTTVWTCYSGEARTRRLQGRGDSSIRAEDRRRAAFEELNNSSFTRKKKRSKGDNSMNEDSFSESLLPERQALSDRTNTTPRLSQLEMPTNLNVSLNDSVCSQSVELEDEEPKVDPRKLNEKGFDQLTMMHTVHNGRRKVRCLSMDESQTVVKYYPPPKEASRISWGQTISEMDLYRHSPRRTPVKTRPILAQKENSYPYKDDTPSPIVLTRMRKPKTLAKRYKNWPWS